VVIGVLLQFLTRQDYARFGVYFVQRKIVGGVAFFCGVLKVKCSCYRKKSFLAQMFDYIHLHKKIQ
jgi:hypothetical protein